MKAAFPCEAAFHTFGKTMDEMTSFKRGNMLPGIIAREEPVRNTALGEGKGV